MQEGSFSPTKLVMLTKLFREQDFQILKTKENLCATSTLHDQKRENRHCFLKILSSVRFLAKQSVSLKGHSNDSNSRSS